MSYNLFPCDPKIIFLFQCDGCIEKGDYIKRIEDLKPKYVKDEL